MKRLIKKAEIWYHLTNEPNFNYNPNYQNNQAEMGNGLYITPIEDISRWDISLKRREFAIPIDISNLNILDLAESPSIGDMQKELVRANYSAEDVEQYAPKGDTFGKPPFEIATIIVWAKYKGYNAILPYYDSKEGRQIVVLDNANIQFNEPVSLNDLIIKYRRGEIQ